MSLWLCRQEPVKHPFYIEKLGIHIYSSQELCYVIFHNPLLVMEEFVDEPLMAFIRDELDMGQLVMKMERWRKSGDNTDELLMMILQEGDYLNYGELSQFRQKIHSYRKMHPAVYQKNRADALFALHQYAAAISIYHQLLEYPKDLTVDQGFRGKIWNNLGASYACMSRMDKALQAYDKAYYYIKDLSILKRMYYVSRLDEKLSVGERYQAMMTKDLTEEWDQEIEQVREEAKECDARKKLTELFQKDPLKRMSGAKELIHKWKQEYRGMLT